MSCTRRRVKTAHLVVRTERVINAHALVQDLTVKDMWIVLSPRARQKSLIRLMFRGTLLESVLFVQCVLIIHHLLHRHHCQTRE